MSPIRDTQAITPARSRRLTTKTAAFGMSLGLLVPAAWATESALSASPAGAAQSESVAVKATSATVKKVNAKTTLRLAKAQKGKPYRRGADGPRAFDCSGLVKFVMKKQHKTMPRTAQAQYKAAKKIRKAGVKVGDLIFFTSGKHVYHVGIYAGHKKIWHSPRPGQKVKLAKIWTSNYRVGRVTA